jgi:hypothetical protein
MIDRRRQILVAMPVRVSALERASDEHERALRDLTLRVDQLERDLNRQKENTP